MLQITNAVITVVITNLLIIPSLQPVAAVALNAVASFRQRGVTGNIIFSQPSPSSPTEISVSLLGLNQSQNDQYPWHIHQYPFTNGQESPCSYSSVGGHYDPFKANENSNYISDCQPQNKSLCEVGDLSGKFGKLNSSVTSFSFPDSDLSLHGQYSIIGRSVVLHYSNGSRYVCANIDLKDGGDTIVAYVPLRGVSIFGDILISEYSNNATLVYSKLFNTVPASINHNWHIHSNIISSGCSSAEGHYNPSDISTDGNYSTLCSIETPAQCEVGDLSGKGGTLNFVNNFGRILYTDTNLPYTPKNGATIANRSIVVHERDSGPKRIACGNIVETIVRQASARFNGERGIHGIIKFKQASPFSSTEVDIKLNGTSCVSEYYVYETPPGENVQVYEKCLSKYTGNIWNANSTSQDRIGDLSGKNGLLIGDSYNDTFADLNIPLFGNNSIVGRSVVLLHHQNSSEWVCAQIVYDTPTVEVTARIIISGLPVLFTFVQPANDPFADTTITITTALETNTSSSSTASSQSSTAQCDTTTHLLTTSMYMYESFTMSNSEALSSTETESTSDVLPSTASLVVSSVQSVSTLLSSSLYNMQSPSLTPSPTFDGSGDSPLMSRRRRDAGGNGDDDELLIYDDIWHDGLYDEENVPAEVEIQRNYHNVHKRETTMISIDWNVKRKGVNGQPPSDCGSLEQFLEPAVDSSSLCLSGNQLACSAGDLTKKHGMICFNSEDGVRKVFTDSYFPLSGPDSAIGNLLLITNGESSQYVTISNDNAQQEAVTCMSSSSTLSSTQTSAMVTPTKIIDNYGLPLSLPIFIGVCVGGVLVLAVLIVAIIIIIVCCAKRRNSYNFQTYAKSKSSGVELGLYKRSNPIFGIATYKVLYDYKVQEEGDLELMEGEIVTLIEAPAGGDWWKGAVDGKEGWFPKSYVNYIDVKAEEKKKKEAEMDRVTAVIKAYTIAGSRVSTLQVDSTPMAVTKFDKPIKEENEFNLPSTPPESGRVTPCLNSNRIVSPTSATATGNVFESPPPSNESLQSSESPPPVSTSSVITRSPSPHNDSLVPSEDIFIAKFDLIPETESELKLVAGEQVVVIERADNGWWHGVIGDNHGWIPETFLQPLHESANESASTTSEQIEKTENQNNETNFRPRGMTEFHSGVSEEVNVSEYRAIADFESDTEGDLLFKEGDMVLVYWGDENGWWFGAAGSAQGWFPESYVEPVMEDSVHSPKNTLEEKNASLVEGLGRKDDELIEDNGGLNDQITAAFNKREKRQLEKESQPLGEEQNNSSNNEEGGSLADEIAAALKKKQNNIKMSEDDSTMSPMPTDESGAVKSDDTMDKLNTEQFRPLKDRSDSVDKLGSDIASLITTMGFNENLIEEKDTINKPSPKANKMGHQRKAPPPPVNAIRSKGPKRSKKLAANKNIIQHEQSPSPSAGTVPIPPPSLPLPSVLSVSQQQPVIDKGKTDIDTNKEHDASAESLTRPDTPGSTSSTRRKPPSPPSPLVIHKATSSQSPLVKYAIAKSLSPQSGTTPEPIDSHNEIEKHQVPRKNPFPDTEQKVKAQRTVSSWQPQTRNKRSSWKPQTKQNKTEQEPAPRRDPPKPPAMSESSPRIKIQKVKRPGKNIPPPPSAPLPPPPPNKSKAPSQYQRPPPVKNVLSGPPPVKQVLGKQTVKKVSSTPAIASSIVSVDLKTEEKNVIHESPAATSLQTPDQIETLPPAIVLKTTHEPLLASKDDSTTPELQDKLNLEMNNFKLSIEPNNYSEHSVSLKPAISPKPKTKPTVSPKPRRLPGSLASKDLPTLEIKSSSSDDAQNSNNKPHPVPPERTSSLPNTPNSSPCPSPSPLTRENQNSSTEHNTVEKNTSVPLRPTPPRSLVSPNASTCSESEATDDKNGETVPEQHPVVSPRKKSSTLPPRPAPPKTTRKISEPRVRMKNLMSPMTVLEPRPRRTGQSERNDATTLENTTDGEPIPKERTSQQNGSDVKSSNIPSRPPPPVRVNPKSKNDVTDNPDVTTAVHPVPKPRTANSNHETEQP